MKRNLKLSTLAPVLLVCAILFSSCGLAARKKARYETGSGDRLSIVCTVFPSFDFARRISEDCDGIEVRMLLPPGSESHDYEPSLEDIAVIADCDLLICVGGETDKWLGDALAAVGDEKSLNVLRMLDCTDALAEEILEGMEAEESHDRLEHDHNSRGDSECEVEVDEHVWTSLRRSRDIIRRIESEMSKLVPEYEENFTASAEKLVKELEELDEEFLSLFEESGKKTLIFADRFPFRYFADDYGLECYAAFPGCSSDSEPSLATLNFLIKKMKEKKLPAVLTIEFSKETAARVVADGTGARILTLHSCHNISGEDLDSGVGYVDLMRRNLGVLREIMR